MLYLMPATRRHARLIGPHLRPADKQEIQAVTGEDPVAALYHAIDLTPEPWTVMLDRTPVGMGGVVPNEPGVGIGWLVGTPAMTANPSEFARAGAYFLEQVFRPFEIVTNYIDIRNTVHIRWLRWLGCEFHEVIPMGPESRPFRRFTLVPSRCRHAGGYSDPRDR